MLHRNKTSSVPRIWDYVLMKRAMKKDVDYYMSLPYRTEIVPDPEEGGVALSCPELPGCVTCAENIADGYAMLEDAKAAWFRSCLENGNDIPMPALKKD